MGEFAERAPWSLLCPSPVPSVDQEGVGDRPLRINRPELDPHSVAATCGLRGVSQEQGAR